MGVRMDWYIGKTAFLTMATVVLCGALLMFIFSLLDLLQGAPAHESFLDSLSRAVRAMPRKIEELAPFAVFLGALIGLGNLSTHSELTILRSSGVSVNRLFASACIPSLCMIVLAQLVIPNVFAADERGQRDRARGFESAWLSEGLTYTRLGWIESDESLHDIRQYELDEQDKVSISRTSPRAEYVPELGAWQLEDVVTTHYLDNLVETQHTELVLWRTTRTPDSLKTLFTTEPRKMSLLELRRQIDDLKAVQQDPAEFEIAYWTKLTKPLSVLGLVLIALAFVIGSSRVLGVGTRITIGIVVGFAFHYLQTLIAPMSVVFHVPPSIAILAPLVLVWTIGLVLLRRTA